MVGKNPTAETNSDLNYKESTAVYLPLSPEADISDRFIKVVPM